MAIYEKSCYGCGGCVQICPKKAVTMKPGKDGVLRPEIDENLCVACGLCERVCPDRNPGEKFAPETSCAAVCKDPALLKNAASGGAFSALAKAVLESGGVVFGSALPGTGEGFAPVHIQVDSLEELPRLQGSKYAQSDTSRIYIQVKKQLEAGKTVLFSGTPCQVDGLYGFLGGRTYDNLWTVDLICHGVPSGKLLDDYLRTLEKKHRISVRDFQFRGKHTGWGKFAYRMTWQKAGKVREVHRPANRSSYYWLFLKGAMYRDNCYDCPYAAMKRVADLTIGDWWGIEKEYPAYLGDQPGSFQVKDGISCILVNTDHGMDALARFGSGLHRKPTDPAAIARWNRQLCAPQQAPDIRQKVMEAYIRTGYEGVEAWYRKKTGVKGMLRRGKDWWEDLTGWRPAGME